MIEEEESGNNTPRQCTKSPRKRTNTNPEEIEFIRNLFRFALHYCGADTKSLSYKRIAETAYYHDGTLVFPPGETRELHRITFHNFKKAKNKGSSIPPPKDFHPLARLQTTDWLVTGSKQKQRVTVIYNSPQQFENLQFSPRTPVTRHSRITRSAMSNENSSST